MEKGQTLKTKINKHEARKKDVDRENVDQAYTAKGQESDCMGRTSEFSETSGSYHLTSVMSFHSE